MHQKLFGSRTPPAHSAPPDPLAAFRGGEGRGKGQGKGEGRVGRVKGRGEDGEGREEGEGRQGRKERKWVVPHPKLNPGCATGYTVNSLFKLYREAPGSVTIPIIQYV